MDISELLDTPDGAVLAAIGGEVALVTMRHESVNKVTIERVPLGAVIAVDAVMALLGAQYLEGGNPLAMEPRPVLAAPKEQPFSCPDCDQRFATARGLGGHRRFKHSVQPGIINAVTCPLCPRTFQNQHALEVHAGRAHRGKGWAVKPVVTQVAEPPPEPPPVRKPPPGPPVVAAMPTDPRGMCDACGMPNRNHLSCEECARRIGPGHTVEAPARQHRGKVWCESCVEVLRQETAHGGKAAVR